MEVQRHPSIVSFVDGLKLCSLLILAIVGVGIGFDEGHRAARFINHSIALVSVLIATALALKLLHASVIIEPESVRNAFNEFFPYSPVIPIVAYSVLDLSLLMRRSGNGTRHLAHERTVARRFLVYCDLPAAVPLTLVSFVTLTGVDLASASDRELLLSGAMAFVVFSHAISSKAVDVYNPHPKEFNSARIRMVAGHLLPERLSRIQISMHKSNCSGEPLRAIVEWLHQSGARSVEFQIADTLHRHNVQWQLGFSAEDADVQARELGDAWIGSNKETLDYAVESFSSIRIVRWDHWIKHGRFGDYLERIRALYESDEEFASTVQMEANDYFIRNKRTITNERMNLALRYLLEEISVTEQCADRELSNEIYPGSQFAPEEYICRAKPKGVRLSYLNYVRIDI